MINVSGNLIEKPKGAILRITENNTNLKIPAILTNLIDYNIGSPNKYLGLSFDIKTSGIERAVKGNYGFLLRGPDNNYIFDCS
jgi:hypothetical protein